MLFDFKKCRRKKEKNQKADSYVPVLMNLKFCAQSKHARQQNRFRRNIV